MQTLFNLVIKNVKTCIQMTFTIFLQMCLPSRTDSLEDQCIFISFAFLIPVNCMFSRFFNCLTFRSSEIAGNSYFSIYFQENVTKLTVKVSEFLKTSNLRGSQPPPPTASQFPPLVAITVEEILLCFERKRVTTISN